MVDPVPFAVGGLLDFGGVRQRLRHALESLLAGARRREVFLKKIARSDIRLADLEFLGLNDEGIIAVELQEVKKGLDVGGPHAGV